MSDTAGESVLRIKPSEIEPLRGRLNVSAKRLTLRSGDQSDPVEADAAADSRLGIASGQ